MNVARPRKLSRALALDRRGRWLALLERRIAEHNRLVLLVALLTLLVAASLWYLLYAVFFWLLVLAAAVVHGVDARPPEAAPALFIYSAGLLVLLTWLAGKRAIDDRPKDEVTLLDIASDLLLAVPRATLAVWGNLSAWQRLSASEIEAAADFLHLLENERRIPLHRIPLELPAPESRLRILLALRLLELIHVQRSGDATWLVPVKRGS
jgi:hypothetical protein